MGGQEYSGIRPRKDAEAEKEFDKLVAGYAPALDQMLRWEGGTGERGENGDQGERSLTSWLQAMLLPWTNAEEEGRGE